MAKRDRTNEDWLAELVAAPTIQERALSALRRKLVSGLRAGLRSWAGDLGREFNELIEDFAQEALLIVLRKMDTFEGACTLYDLGFENSGQSRLDGIETPSLERYILGFVYGKGWRFERRTRGRPRGRRLAGLAG